MLTGKELGEAIAVAIELKKVSKATVARAFEIKPPSVSDWVKRGTVDKSKLENLFKYFSDVVGPEHWGISGEFGSSGIAQNVAAYPVKVHPLPEREAPEIAEVVALMRAVDDKGRAMALGAVKAVLAGYKPAKANRAS